ncbi:tetratricopeptide repeat protein [Candidatus Woesearchaeota archaeon]|nr:tetratricopeptide repeat protein [Candidatus Woesearchaeota archaeon]
MQQLRLREKPENEKIQLDKEVGIFLLGRRLFWRMEKKKLLFPALLALSVILLYANSFPNKFVWDDRFFIEGNTQIRSLQNIPSFFTEPSAGNLYRPVRTVLQSLMFQVGGLNPVAYHLHAVLLYTAITLLIFYLLRRITQNKALSFLSALFFAVHPLHTDRVANMTAAFDLWGIFFLLLGLYFWIGAEYKKKYFLIALLSYAIALFASEEALAFIPLLLLYEFSFHGWAYVKGNWKRYSALAAMTIFYLFVRFQFVPVLGRNDDYFLGSFAVTFLTTVKVVARYIVMLVAPFNLSVEHYVKLVKSPFDPLFVLSVLFLLAILAIGILQYKKSKIVFFSILWFFVALLPFYNLVPQLTIMADRYLFLPSLGFALLLAFLVLKIKNLKGNEKIWRNIGKAIAVFILLFFSFLAIQRNLDWRDDMTLALKTVQTDPLNTKANEQLARVYQQEGNYPESILYAKNAIDLSENNYVAHEILATSYAHIGKYPEAIQYYIKAIQLKPDFYLAHNNLGLVYKEVGLINQSIKALKNAIAIDPSLSKAYHDLGIVYASEGRFDEAIKEIETAISLHAYNPDYFYNLGVIYEYLNQTEKAQEHFKKALELEPGNEKIQAKLS